MLNKISTNLSPLRLLRSQGLGVNQSNSGYISLVGSQVCPILQANAVSGEVVITEAVTGSEQFAIHTRGLGRRRLGEGADGLTQVGRGIEETGYDGPGVGLEGLWVLVG